MAPEERKRHRRPSAADDTNLDDDSDAPNITAEDLVNLTFQQVPSLENDSTPEIDPGSDSKIRHGTFNIHWDPRLSCRVVDFIGDIEVRRVRPAIRCPFHSTPVLSPHRIDVDPSVGGLASASWSRLPKSDHAEEATHECLATICGAVIPPPSHVPDASHGNMPDPRRPNQSRVSVYQYTLNKAKAKTSLRNDDGAFAFIPQTGPITLDTELGLLELRVGDVGVVPAGIHLSISPSRTAGAEVLSGGCAGYVLEVVGAAFDLAADSDFAVASGPWSHEEGPHEDDGKEWTHFVKDSSPPKPCMLPSYLTTSGAIPAWMPPNPPPSHSNAGRPSKEQQEECDGEKSIPATNNKVNPLQQYTLAHGPLDVVAWEVEGSQCADLPYKVRMSVPGPDQREPWPVLRADHGDGHVTELRMFNGRVQTPLWDAPNAAAAVASSGTSIVADGAAGGVGDEEQPRDGLNVAYGVIRGTKDDESWQGLRAGDLVVQAPGARDGAAVVSDSIPHSDPSQCHDLLGFSFTFPGKLGFSEWALTEHPARISSTTA